jgi:hypothetical protein
MSEQEALSALARVFERSEFRPGDSSPNAAAFLLQLILRYLADLLGQLLSPVQEVAGGHPSLIGITKLVIALAVVAGATWFFGRTLRFGMARETVAAARSRALQRQRSDTLWQEAHQLARQGKLEEATRLLYLSALYALEEHDVLRVNDALTNREHAQRLAASQPGHSELFARVVQRYDPIRYGGVPVDSAAFEDLNALVERARAL